jgi:hypothetical protein
MDISSILIVLGFLLVFGLIVYVAVTSGRKDLQRKQELAQQLGFAPMIMDPHLADRISHLYHRPDAQNKYQVRNTFRRVIPDGEMYLFDLVETSSDEDTYSENQAVAIISTYLTLPQFTLFPKADPKYALSGVANKILEWGMSKVGTPIAFPESPEFQARYIVTSEDDANLVGRFFDPSLAGYFSRTQLYMLRGMGNIFTFAEMDPQFKKPDQEILSRRVNRALEIFRQFQTRSSQ